MINFDYNTNEYSTTQWDFGDGNTSTDKYTQHAYASPGTYTVSLFVQNGCGNDTTITSTVNVVTNLPYTGNINTYFNPNPVCPNDNVSFEINKEVYFSRVIISHMSYLFVSS